MLKTFINDLSTEGKVIMSACLIAIVGLVAYLLYGYFHPAQPVTTLSQQQAETPAGIKQAADNAHVTLLQDQLNQASQQIAMLKNQKPDTVIKVVPVEIEKVVTQYVKTSGADFAIVTEPANPTKQVNLKEVAVLPATTDVTLNQYNVFAYKKIIRDVTVYPSFTGIMPSGISEVDVGISRKITNNGVYVGVVAGYEFDDKKAKVGLRITY